MVEKLSKYTSFLVGAIVSNILLQAEVGDELWSFSTGDAIFSTPAVDASGNLYFGGVDGEVYSLDPDGNERWSVTTGDWVESSPALSPDGSVVYVGSWDDKLYAIDTTTGATDWTFETSSLIFSSPAVADDGKIVFGGSDGTLYSVNPDGSDDWDVTLGGELDSSVVIGPNGNNYAATSEGSVFCHDSSGEELWTWDVPNEFGALLRERSIFSSIIHDGVDTIYFGCDNFYVYALDASDGSLRWKYETDGIVSASATIGIDGNILISSRDGYIYCLDTQGDLVWRTQIGANYYTSATVDEIGRIYVSSFINDSLSRLNVLSPYGAIVQQKSFTDIIDTSVVLGPDGTLYLGTNDGSLYAFENQSVLGNTAWPKFRRTLKSRGELQGYAPPVSGFERLSNISLRGASLGGDDNIIAGFVISGSGTKEMLARAVGPGLIQFGVSGTLADPKLEFHQDGVGLIHENNEWGEDGDESELADEMNDVGAFPLDSDSLDSAALLELGAGSYSCIAKGNDGGTGVVLVEVYDADEVEGTARLANVSMRGRVGEGDEVLITGFVVAGNLPKRLLIRAVGPELGNFGLSDFVADPLLEVFEGSRVLDSNDDWGANPDLAEVNAAVTQAGAFTLSSAGKDSILLVWLEPGAYTAVVSAASGSGGTGLIEIYDVTD